MSLVAHYKMDDNEANTIVLDSWAGANNGTSIRNTNINSTTGKINDCLRFNEDDNLIAHWKMNDDTNSTNVIDSLGINDGTTTRNTEDLSITEKINDSLFFGDRDLVAHWTFNDSTSTDIRGGFNGTNTNINYYAGKVGTGAGFDTSTSHIDVDANETLNLKEAISVSLWYKPDSTPSGGYYRYIFRNSGGTWDANIKFFMIHEESGRISWSIVPEGAIDHNNYYRLFENDAPLTPGTWYHIVCTYNSVTGTSNIYINNVLERTHDYTPANIIDLNIPITIGGGGDGGATQNLKGMLDDVRYYSKELTTDEISYIYNSNSGTDEEYLDYVNCGNDNSLLMTGDVSLGCWFYLTKGTKAKGKRIGLIGKHYEEYEVFLDQSSGAANVMKFYKSNGSGGYEESSLLYSFEEETWYNVYITFDSSTKEAIWYVNGEQEKSHTFGSSSLIDNQNHNFDIGKRSGSLTEHFPGKIDDVRLYDKILTSEEVTGLYNSNNGTEEVFLDNINCGNDSSLDFDASGEFSIAMWVYPNNVGDDTLIKKEGSGKGFRLDLGGLAVNNLRMKNPNGWNYYEANVDILAGEWSHVVMTYNNQIIKFYINSVIATNFGGTPGTWASDTTSDVIIGKKGTDNFDGKLDDIRIYNNALTLDDVLKLFDITPKPNKLMFNGKHAKSKFGRALGPKKNIVGAVG